MNTKEILRRCGYEHGKDQVSLEYLNLKAERERKPKSVGRFVMHIQDHSIRKQVTMGYDIRNPPEVGSTHRSPDIDLLESPDYVQYSFLAIHKDHRGITK